MQKHLWIVRHGETDFNKNHIVQGSGINSSLNQEGKSQAALFYQRYKDEEFDLIATSALVRTEETVDQFIKDGIAVRRSPLINEICWGIHEGKPYTKEMRDSYDELIANWGKNKLDAALPSGESANQLRTRLKQFLEEVTESMYNKVLICTHGRAIRCLMTIINNEHPREMEKYTHHNTGLFKAVWSEGKYEMILNNDTSHLL